jgi:Phage-related protein, tail component
MPGELIEIADPDKTPGIAAGIVVAGSSSTRIILDRAVTINSGTSYRLQVVFPDQNYGTDVTTGAGTHTAINVASAFPSAPAEGTTWLLRPTSAERRKYRVIGLNENEDNTVTVVATEHNEDKYDLVETSTYFTASVSSVARTRVVPVVTPSSIVLTTS